ncbi:hypothetical protein [Liquorilactobacillus satsumensis]|uniref:hypothetical protein n=1 Tax=Liquorilactobacillus satsumensis TaxID=259059 RepID=UPI0039EB3C50
MKIKDTKKPVSANNFGELHTSGLKNNRAHKKSTFLYSNEKADSSQQNANTDSRNVNTHFFDRPEYKTMPESLQRTGNAIAFGQSGIRTADKIASQLNMTVRKIFKNVETMRSNYNIPVIGDNHKPQGMFIATNTIEAQRYLSQQKAREDRGAKARRGVENGLKNGFLEDVQQWQKGAQHD